MRGFARDFAKQHAVLYCSVFSRIFDFDAMQMLSFVCEWVVGEVGHLVRDLEVLLCPFPLGNKSCPVKWTKKKIVT